MRVGQYYLKEKEKKLYEKAREKYKRNNGGVVKKEKNFFLALCKAYLSSDDLEPLLDMIEKLIDRQKKTEEAARKTLERLEREGIGDPTVIEKLRKGLGE